jgi:ubiquitin-conjugating enzyme E2 S
MSLNNISNVNTSTTPSPIITKLLWRQQQELLIKFPDCVKIIINHEDPLDIQADINGPKETPYEKGVFRVKILVGSDFPYTAPKGIFTTKIYHPNVSEKGEICVNTLNKDWNPKGWSLYNVLEVKFLIIIKPLNFFRPLSVYL